MTGSSGAVDDDSDINDDDDDDDDKDVDGDERRLRTSVGIRNKAQKVFRCVACSSSGQFSAQSHFDSERVEFNAKVI